MRYLISTTILITILTYRISAQQISSEGYNKEYINEDFKKITHHFKIVTNADNYFIIDKEEYLLSRHNKEDEYIIIAENSNISDFILRTSIKIEPSENKQSAIGFILKTETENQNGIIFEINTKREYRVKQISEGKYENLSGQKKQKGWVKNKLVNGCDEYNYIEIRSERNLYDVYINTKYLTSFFIPDLNSGKFGIIIGPETKARLSYYNINIKGNELKENYETRNDTIERLYNKINLLEKRNNTLLNNLNTEKEKNKIEKLESEYIKSESINKRIQELTNKDVNIRNKNKKLSTDLLKQKNKIEDLSLSLEKSKKTTLEMKLNNQKLNKQVSNLNHHIYLLEDQIKIMNSKNDSLKTINNQLKELFIIKDFEGNGIDTSVINKNESLKITNHGSANEKEIIYSVQIGVYMQEQIKISTNTYDIWYKETENKTYTYYSGKFNSKQQATIHMKELISMGYTNLFIVTLKE